MFRVSSLRSLTILEIWTQVIWLDFKKFSVEIVFYDLHGQKHCACVTVQRNPACKIVHALCFPALGLPLICRSPFVKQKMCFGLSAHDLWQRGYHNQTFTTEKGIWWHLIGFISISLHSDFVNDSTTSLVKLNPFSLLDMERILAWKRTIIFTLTGALCRHIKVLSNILLCQWGLCCSWGLCFGSWKKIYLLTSGRGHIVNVQCKCFISLLRVNTLHLVAKHNKNFLPKTGKNTLK